MEKQLQHREAFEKELYLQQITQIYRAYFSTDDLADLCERLKSHVPQWQQESYYPILCIHSEEKTLRVDRRPGCRDLLGS